MKISELKDKLEKAGHALKTLDGLNKAELEQLLEQSELIVNAVESNENSSLATSNSEDVLQEEPTLVRLPTDLDWTEYVLSLLNPDREIDNGNPKTDGLRRVAEVVYGPFSITTKVIDTPNINNGYRASVVVSVNFLNSGLLYDGAADVYSGNTDKKFAVHALATAETRAEGRALRRALKLTKVLAAEETYNADIDEPTGLEESSGMPSTMLTSLELMAKNTGVDLLRLSQKQGYKVTSIKELTKEQGLALSKALGEIKRKTMELTDDIKA